MRKQLWIGIVLAVLMAVVLAAVTSSPLNVNRKMRLQWDPNPPQDYVSYYTVYLWQGSVLKRSLNVTNTEVQLLDVFNQQLNGVYTLYLTATSELSALESDPSDSFAVFWYGQKPGKPQNPGIDFPQ
jgi:hypothetical protein